MNLDKNEVGRIYDLVTGELEDIEKHNAEGQYNEDIAELERIQEVVSNEFVRLMVIENNS